MTTLDRTREVFANDRFATTQSGIEITAVGAHEAECTMHVDERHCNARGATMGGALFTLADFAAAIAANSDDIESGDLHWVSLDATIHYLSPAITGTSLRASCSALKSGRATALYQTIIESLDNGKRIAIVETTMIRV
ncbi:MAG: PaaI family thioesterase [Bacteroidales bacterium]|nr:PaaI family thioesterase [Bacteroidales bacterium]